MLDHLHNHGFAHLPNVLPSAQIAALIEAVTTLPAQAAVREKFAATYAVRHLCHLVPAVHDLARSLEIRNLIELTLGPAARVVRSLLFDKNPAANWKVPWHQDLAIAVEKRIDVPGFGPWSVKAGVLHVQPPARVLESMLTLRLHLDDCGPDNGPLRVLPGTHILGPIDPATIPDLRQQIPEVSCEVPAGGVLLMRPLLLHASAPATKPGHRRVIHLEFAAADLPAGLRWHECA